MAADPLNDAIVRAIARAACKEHARKTQIRGLIKMNGTEWAVSEIFKLQMELAQTRARIEGRR